jgi:hypothetical protein
VSDEPKDSTVSDKESIVVTGCDKVKDASSTGSNDREILIQIYYEKALFYYNVVGFGPGANFSFVRNLRVKVKMVKYSSCIFRCRRIGSILENSFWAKYTFLQISSFAFCLAIAINHFHFWEGVDKRILRLREAPQKCKKTFRLPAEPPGPVSAAATARFWAS